MKKLLLILFTILLIPILATAQQKPVLGTQLRSDGHWSTQGLVGYWYLPEGAGNRIFDLGRHNRYAVATGTAGKLSWAVNEAGPCIDSAGGGIAGWKFTPQIVVTDNDPWTLVFACELDDVVNSGVIFAEYGSLGPYVWLREGTGIRFGAYSLNDYKTFSAYTTYALRVDGLGVASSNLDVFINGVFSEREPNVSSGWTFDSIGGGYNNATYQFDGRTGWVWFYNRALSSAEIQEYNMNPYIALKKPARARFMYPNPAAPAPAKKVPIQVLISKIQGIPGEWWNDGRLVAVNE